MPNVVGLLWTALISVKNKECGGSPKEDCGFVLIMTLDCRSWL